MVELFTTLVVLLLTLTGAWLWTTWELLTLTGAWLWWTWLVGLAKRE